MSARKVIVTIAPTGGMAGKAQNPHLPTQPAEIAEDVYRSYNAGASVAAIHARRADDEATCDPAIYRRINERVRQKCDIVINNSTGGGVNGDLIRQAPNGYWEIMWDERLKGLEAGAEMCTLDPATIVASFGGKEILMNTSPSRCRELASAMKQKGIKPEWEVFSPNHIVQDTAALIADGYDEPPYFINIVLGCDRGFQGAMPYTPKILQMMVDLMPPGTIVADEEAMPFRDAAFDLAVRRSLAVQHSIRGHYAADRFNTSAIGPAQLPATVQTLLLGGHVRVGLEDNLYYAPGEHATNPRLVERIVRIIRDLGMEPASAAEARTIMGLPRLLGGQPATKSSATSAT
jgi:3-keto-5-aminohexanoate cleavage enzyme